MPGFDDADGDADQRLGRRAAAVHVHVEVQPDAEIAGDERRRRGVVAGIGQHAVDVGRLQAGVGMAVRTAKVPIARVVLPEPRV